MTVQYLNAYDTRTIFRAELIDLIQSLLKLAPTPTYMAVAARVDEILAKQVTPNTIDYDHTAVPEADR